MREGDVLAGRYRLTRPLKSGARGQVWLAEHLALDGTVVAVKLVDRTWAGDDETQERFKREANAAAALRSPHVVQILDHGVAEGAPFVVMELLEGQTLAERLRKPPRLELAATQSIITQVARALTKAHAAGIVHRDLRPGHVFLVSNEDDEVVKVLGFGVAASAPGTASTVSAPALPYQSPEQLRGGEVGPATDVWALGVIAYESIAGKVPFSAIRAAHLLGRLDRGERPTPASRSRPGIPAAFDAWFSKACALDPAKRFASAREMADELANVVRESPTHQPRASSRPPPTKEESAVDDAWSDDTETPALPKVQPAPRVPSFDMKTGASVTPIPRPQSSPSLRPGSSPSLPRPQSSPALRPQSSPSLSRPQSSPALRPGSSPSLSRPQSSPALRPQSSPSLRPGSYPTIPPRPQSSADLLAKASTPPPKLELEAPSAEEAAVVIAPVVEVKGVDEPIEAAPPSSAEVVLDDAPVSKDEMPPPPPAPPPEPAPRPAVADDPVVAPELAPVSRPRPPGPSPVSVRGIVAPSANVTFDLEAVDVDLPPELDIGAKGRRFKRLAIGGAIAGAVAILAVVVVPYLREEQRPAAAPPPSAPAVVGVEAARPVEAPPAPTPEASGASSTAAVDPGLAASALAEEAKKAAAASSAKKPVLGQPGRARPPREDEVEIPQPDPE